jgi:phospholipid/cholesterol/gamma-HCH transport system ATP-binding protein
MSQVAPVLQLTSALPFFDASALPNVPLDLQLMPGDCAVIETSDPARTTALADLCSGLTPLRDGEVRFMGYDWTGLDRERAAALRGRIGRIYLKGAWIAMLGTHVNIMLAQLHHTREPEPSIAQSAAELARQLGLPGLPLARPDRLSEGDLMRGAFVRAFLGEPRLLLLESTITPERAELTVPVLDLLSRALYRGAAAVCFTRDAPFWQAQRFPVTYCLQLRDDGLKPMSGV